MVDYLLLILSGLAIGIIVAAPIGPVNLICIRRTLAFGPLNGFLSGLGAAIGDSVFGIVTAFGLTAIAQLIKGFYVPLQIVGGLMLIGFGVHTIFAKPKKRELDEVKGADKGASTLVGAIVSTFALTITNPATLFGFAALFAGLGSLIGEKPRFAEAAILVGGVAGGLDCVVVHHHNHCGPIPQKHRRSRDDMDQPRDGRLRSRLFGVAVLGNLLRAQFA